MSDLTSEIALWVSKLVTVPSAALAPEQVEKYPDAQLPVDLRRDNDQTLASALLEAKARALVEMHENRAFSGLEPFTQDDYAAFSAAHKDIAEGHRLLGEEIKMNQPDAIQAISAHGDAMAAHNGASKLAEMMLPAQELGERNKMWPHMDSNSFRYGRNAPWDTEDKNWRKAHQAFLASQMANRQTAFGTGVVIKGDFLGHPFRGNQWTSLGEKASAINDAVKSLKASSGPETIRGLSVAHFGIANQHDMVSAQHEELPYLTDASEIGRKTYDNLSESSANAVDLHSDAAALHNEAGDYLRSAADAIERGDRASASEHLAAAKEASASAKQASLAANKTSLAYPVGDPEFRDHEDKMMSEALGKSAEIAKGDVDGHPFHGNQYTEGSGSGSGSNHIADIKGVDGRTFSVHVVPTGGKYGRNDVLTNDTKPIIEFYDKSYPDKFGEKGQFVSSYYADTLLAHPAGVGLDLQGDVAEWKIPGSELDKIMGDVGRIAVADAQAKMNKSAEIIRKGDVEGHIFHGNQYVSGTTSIPSDVGHRDFDPQTTLGQIGKMNILGVSGGKVHTIHDTDGKSVGLELPVSSGYKVRVFLRDDDTYTVQRVHRDNVKGEQTGVYADEVGEAVYQAGMYKSNPFGGHSPR